MRVDHLPIFLHIPHIAVLPRHKFRRLEPVPKGFEYPRSFRERFTLSLSLYESSDNRNISSNRLTHHHILRYSAFAQSIAVLSVVLVASITRYIDKQSGESWRRCGTPYVVFIEINGGDVARRCLYTFLFQQFVKFGNSAACHVTLVSAGGRYLLSLADKFAVPLP